jgi:adenosine deaminase/adenosine deaminase CECR1
MLYYLFHVPIVISTDDAGVNRSSLTEQYALLALRYKELSYADIKKFVYNNITYSFMSNAKKEALKKDLDERFKKFEQYALTNQPH